jgi:hypothetical protein
MRETYLGLPDAAEKVLEMLAELLGVAHLWVGGVYRGAVQGMRDAPDVLENTLVGLSFQYHGHKAQKGIRVSG